MEKLKCSTFLVLYEILKGDQVSLRPICEEDVVDRKEPDAEILSSLDRIRYKQLLLVERSSKEQREYVGIGVSSNPAHEEVEPLVERSPLLTFRYVDDRAYSFTEGGVYNDPSAYIDEKMDVARFDSLLIAARDGRYGKIVLELDSPPPYDGSQIVVLME